MSRVLRTWRTVMHVPPVKWGVAVATSGPGATNLVTGIATAMLDSSPIVCITGQVPSALIGRDAFQEVDVTGITLPITKHNYLVHEADDIGPVLKEAFHIARSGRPGPVLVDITKDAQQVETDWVWDDSEVTLPGYRPRHETLPEEFEHAIELVNGAKRPVILAGQGVIKSGATELLIQFAEKTPDPGHADSTRSGRVSGISSTQPGNDGDAR